MKRQWWEVAAHAEPFAFLSNLGTSCPPPPLLPFPEREPDRSAHAPTQLEAEPMSFPEEADSYSISPQADPPSSPEPCSPHETDLDNHTTNILAKALKVEPRHVPVEALAYSLLCKHTRGYRILKSDVAEIWDTIPSNLKYSDPKGGPGKYVVFGAHPRKHDQITNPSLLLPHCTELCVRYIQQTHPDFEFSTFALRLNMRTPPHRDMRNGSDASYIHCLTQVEGGELWVFDPAGDVELQHLNQTLPGKVHDVHAQPVIFEARSKLHATMPWKGESRLVLVAFTTLHALASAPVKLWLEGLSIPMQTKPASLKQPTLQQTFDRLRPAPVEVPDDSL